MFRATRREWRVVHLARWGIFTLGLVASIFAASTALRRAAVAAGDEKEPANAAQTLAEQKAALAEFNSLIGKWRGVGLPRRGSRAGAWTEKAEWVWRFGKNSAAVDYKVDKGKLLQSARVTYDPERKLFSLAGTFADKTLRAYTGRLEKEKLIFESVADDDGYVHLLTIRRLNEKRSLVLYQKRRADSRFLSRVAEVGYTRAGTSLAVAGAGEIECIVTGGKGTIPVTYQGKTYYVCCTGCRDAFNDDPEGILAEYSRKLAERQKERATKP